MAGHGGKIRYPNRKPSNFLEGHETTQAMECLVQAILEYITCIWARIHNAPSLDNVPLDVLYYFR